MTQKQGGAIMIPERFASAGDAPPQHRARRAKNADGVLEGSVVPEQGGAAEEKYWRDTAMCCRCYVDESEEFRVFIEQMNRSPLTDRWKGVAEIITHGEVRPANVVPVIAPDRSGHRAVYPMKWGYQGRSLLVNARTETASQKPTFREDWRKHRCIVPASWYFEWEHHTGSDGKKHTGDKYRIRPKGQGLTWLCGLYRIENHLPVFVILTREPGEGIRFLHDRMPLILPERFVDEWIRPETEPEKLLPYALTDMECVKAE